MINREDMLELTRRMTPSRTCFDRIAGAYISETGEIEDTFNIHFGKLSGAEKARNLKLAKTIPFSRTNEQLKEYTFADRVKGKDSVWMLLQAVQQCGLKNDVLMEILYEQIADAYPVPSKSKDGESLWESEEVYDFIICTISPLEDEYEPGEPVFGFLYPAFSDRSPDQSRIDIYHVNSDEVEEGLLYKITGKV